jgi:AcrR family transcriptional regulator
VGTPDQQGVLERAGSLTSRGERTRQRLLEVAIRRFAERGYRETSLSAIAREAGVTPAAVYAYAAGKEGLMRAAFEHDVELLFDEAVPGVDDVPAPWLGLVPLMLAGLPAHPLAHRVLRGLEPELTPRLRDAPSLGLLRAALERTLRAGQQAGSVRPELDAAQVARGLEALLVSLLLAAVQTGPSDAGQGVLALLATALLPGAEA